MSKQTVKNGKEICFVFSHNHNINSPRLGGLIRVVVVGVSFAQLFTGMALAQTISGNIQSINGVAIPGVTVSATRLSPFQQLTNNTDASGNYSITPSPNRTYTVTAAKSGYTFTPASTNVSFPFFGGPSYVINFTTPATIPTAFVLGSQPGVSVNPTTEILEGASNPDGADTMVYFQYGLTTNYGSVSSSNDIGSGITTLAVSNTVFGLINGTNYHLRLVATNRFGLTLGNDATFATPSGTPVPVTLPAAAITSSSATLNGSVNPNGQNATAWFKWGPDTNYGNSTTPQSLGSGTTALVFSNNVTGLTPGVVYHYLTAATNVYGLANGADETFSFAVVTNTADSGPGTLRQLIMSAGSSGGIAFATNLAGATILLTGVQLTLSNNLTIDASALPGGIRIDGDGQHLLTTHRIFNVVSNATVVLTALTVTNGYETNFGGGGIYNSGSLTLNQCTIAANYTSDYGGGIFNSGTLTLSQCTLTGNSAYGGGGIYNTGTITAMNLCTLTGNSAYVDGGGIFNYGTSAAMNQCTIIGSVCYNGGGIFNAGPMTVNQCTITGNIAGNVETGGGGSAINAVVGLLTVNQSTIAGNMLPANGVGGISLDNEGNVSICNSIVAGNGGNDIAGVNDFLTFTGANIVQSMEQGVVISGPTPITNAPLLAPLGNYGGPTLTMPPLPGSPAIDGCTNSTFTYDQRGFPRVVGLAPDIGAVEGIYNPAGPGKLTGMTRFGNGSTRFTFTNFTDTSFTVLANANVALPVSAWTNLGPAVESPIGSGHFQFTDPQATNLSQRFYRVRSP